MSDAVSEAVYSLKSEVPGRAPIRVQRLGPLITEDALVFSFDDRRYRKEGLVGKRDDAVYIDVPRKEVRRPVGTGAMARDRIAESGSRGSSSYLDTPQSPA